MRIDPAWSTSAPTMPNQLEGSGRTASVIPTQPVDNTPVDTMIDRWFAGRDSDLAMLPLA